MWKIKFKMKQESIRVRTRRTGHGVTNLDALNTRLVSVVRWEKIIWPSCLILWSKDNTKSYNLQKLPKYGQIKTFNWPTLKVTDFCPGVPGYCSLDYPGGLCTFECLTVMFRKTQRWNWNLNHWVENQNFSGSSYSLLLCPRWHLAALSYLWGGSIKMWMGLISNILRMMMNQ